MPTVTCPKGHQSTEPDFCSICGSKLLPEAAAPPATVTACPDCGAPHDASGAIFCEVCGFNYSTGSHGDFHPSPAVQPSPEPDPAPDPAAPAAPVQAWEAVVTVDPSLRAEGSPEPPTDFAPLTVALSKESNLIGRTSEKRGIAPEIALDHDDAVSHRHALLDRQPDGTLVLRDIGSANGTYVAGVELKPLTDAPIKDGDTFTLGHWTRIEIKAVI